MFLAPFEASCDVVTEIIQNRYKIIVIKAKEPNNIMIKKIINDKKKKSNSTQHHIKN